MGSYTHINTHIRVRFKKYDARNVYFPVNFILKWMVAFESCMSYYIYVDSDWKTNIQKSSPTNLTELELFRKEKSANLSFS